MPNYSSQPNIDLHLEIYRLAVRRVRARLVFRYHLCAYGLGSSLLVAIYLATRLIPGFPSYLWFLWPEAGWSLTLLLHFLLVFVFSDYRISDQRRHMLETELRRISREG